ncbi:MAG: adenylosuccinate synthetase, partial [Chitinispirillaceae bacterium]|nr:adenylosuccinate synthetase [Chitinispirillaceae bacterium]
LTKAKPVYEICKGWKMDISQCHSEKELPKEASYYIKRIRELCYNVPILMISVGPDRNQTIEVTPL